MVKGGRFTKIVTIGSIAAVCALLFVFLYISLTSLHRVTHQLQVTTKQPALIISQVKDAQFHVDTMRIYANELMFRRDPLFISSINISLKKLYLDTENIYERLKGSYDGPKEDIEVLKDTLENIKRGQDILIVAAADQNMSGNDVGHIIDAQLSHLYEYFDRAVETILLYEQTSLAAVSADSERMYGMTALFVSLLAVAVIAVLVCFYYMQRRTNRQLEEAGISLNEALMKAKSAAKAKSDFLAQMSHDIRTPLNGIIGMNYIAQHNIDDKKIVSDSLKKTEVSAEYLLRLLNDILDMTKIESGKMELSATPFDMGTVLSSVIQIEQSATDQKKLRFIVKVPGSFPVLYVGDRLRLSQILMNLLSNAIKFTPEGGCVSFTASAERKEDARQFFRFTVQDNGIGISDDMMDRLFKPFEQEDSETAFVYGGSGLGLTIVHMLVTMMGGTITVRSKKGKGSVFSVVIPFVPGGRADTAGHVPADGNKDDGQKFRNCRVLVLEDNKINQEILVQILGMHGIIADTADDGKEGLDAFMASEPGTYRMIFTDIRMPAMNGYAFAEAVRRSAHRQAASVPIIALSANAFDDDMKASRAAGINEHLCKPINVNDLLAVLRKYLDGQKDGGDGNA